MNHERLRMILLSGLGALLFCAAIPATIWAQSGGPQSIAPVANPCPRLAAGSVVHNPPSLFSRNGLLTANFSYQTTTDSAGRTLFCFMTPDGLENPTLHVNPGDHLVINVTNNTPASSVEMSIPAPNCGAKVMTMSSVNIHYHGTNTPPTCGQDEVIHTIINSGETFHYNLPFPTDEAPGLYWYHPHVHGMAEAMVQGGATGAIIVEGIQDFQPVVAGLRQRVLVVRDQNVAGNPTPGGPNNIPSWDLTLNNIQIPYPNYPPAVLHMLPGEKQLWRVANASADTQLDLQVVFDGTPQPLKIVALDGVPTGSQDGTRRGTALVATDILIPTASRAEFIVSAPPSGVTNAQLITLNINTGPDGDNDPTRPLANIQVLDSDADHHSARDNDENISASVGPAWPQRFEGLDTSSVTARRKLYFSEVISDPNNPLSPTNFYITVDGATPTLFSPDNPPAIVTTQGSVEDWTVENRSEEVHEFHIHQIHYLVLSQNNFGVNGAQPDATIQGQFLDMINVSAWDGNPDHPYPSVTVRMDFRGKDIGDFVYHCHILGHEDAGMMAIIRVMPANRESAGSSVQARLEGSANSKRVYDRPAVGAEK